MAPYAERTRLTVQPEGFCVIALAFFLFPWQWILGWVAAAIVHEVFHYIAIRLCRCRVWQIHIGLSGTVMQAHFDRPISELLCAAAGPLGSLCLCLVARMLPRIAVCGYIQLLFNLLPIYPNDGGRILKILIMGLCPHRRSESIFRIINGCLYSLILLGVLLLSLYYTLGGLPIVFAVSILLKIKKPCKERLMRVQ